MVFGERPHTDDTLFEGDLQVTPSPLTPSYSHSFTHSLLTQSVTHSFTPLLTPSLTLTLPPSITQVALARALVTCQDVVLFLEQLAAVARNLFLQLKALYGEKQR